MAGFKIPYVQPRRNKCIYFPEKMIKAVEDSIQGLDCTFSAFVEEAVKVALENLEEQK